MTELCVLMARYGSDKSPLATPDPSFPLSGRHSYTPLYSELFGPLKNKALRVFELGLGTNNPNIPSSMGVKGQPGASLRGWRDYFPNAMIFGADIDRDILFEEDRISTFYCDQCDPVKIAEMWRNAELQEDFDIIIEDGLHYPPANICFFESSIHKLKKGGYYIIEDVCPNLQIFQKVNQWACRYPDYEFQIKFLYSDRCKEADNNLVIVHRNQ